MESLREKYMKNGPGRDDPSSEISSSLFFPSWWRGGGDKVGEGGGANTGQKLEN